MSNASPVLNGENTGGIGDFATDASVNMVAAIHDHISCAKPVPVVPFGSQDPKGSIMTYSCEFDHMYASLTDEGTLQKDSTEVKYLKDLLLLHLDLIQQQSEQLVTKDKQLSALRQENETLRQRLERMDRRVTLQKHREVPDSASLPSGNCPPPLAPSPPFTPGPVVVSSLGPLMEADSDTITLPLESVDPSSVVHNSSALSTADPLDTQGMTPNLWEASRRRRRDIDSVSASSGGVGMSRRKRLASWTSSVNSDATSLDSRTPLTKEPSEIGRRTQKRLRTRGAAAAKDNMLLTELLYYTPVGDADVTWVCTLPAGHREPEISGHVEVPSWRHKLYTSCYTMEGTENLDDEVFNKRHQRLEVDERRRKRWDVQRIREQRQIERLKQREQAATRRGSRHHDDEPLASLWPQVEDAQFLEVNDSLPVAAFGLPLTKFPASEFSLPWLSSGRCRSLNHSPRRRHEPRR